MEQPAHVLVLNHSTGAWIPMDVGHRKVQHRRSALLAFQADAPRSHGSRHLARPACLPDTPGVCCQSQCRQLLAAVQRCTGRQWAPALMMPLHQQASSWAPETSFSCRSQGGCVSPELLKVQGLGSL